MSVEKVNNYVHCEHNYLIGASEKWFFCKICKQTIRVIDDYEEYCQDFDKTFWDIETGEPITF